jgi:DNA-binding response OmpR family regulator/signal transduction histidine kinase
MARCLVIDDDRLFRKVTCDVLVSRGHQCKMEETGRDGLRAISEWNPDVVILDLVLPDVSGYDVLAEQVRSGSAHRVIVTTADFSLDSALRTLREGAGDYLPKPFSEEMLHMSVERVLRRLELEKRTSDLSRSLQHRLADLATLQQLLMLMTSSRTMDQRLVEALQMACRYMRSEAGALLLFDVRTDELVCQAAVGPHAEVASGRRLPRGKGMAWWCLENNQPVRVNEPRQDERFDPSIDQIAGAVTRNLLCAPIVVQDQVIGVLEVLNRTGAERFSETDEERVLEVATATAAVVHNFFALRDLQRSRTELLDWSRRLERTVEERTQALREMDQARRIVVRELENSRNAIQQAQSLMLEREKMAALGILAAGVAHEVNNPLGFVKSNLGVLEQYIRSLRRLAGVAMHGVSRAARTSQEVLRRLFDELGRIVEEEKLREACDDMDPLLDEMSHGIARIASIVEQLRYFAEDGRSGDELAEVDLEAEFRRLLDLTRGTRSREFVADFSRKVAVRAPVARLRQVLLNLLGFFAAGEGGQPVKVSTGARNGSAVLVFADESCVIAAEDLPRIFDPFFEPRGGPFPGALGLSAAHGLARSMGASLVAVRSEAGTLRLELHLAMAGEAGAAKDRSAT